MLCGRCLLLRLFVVLWAASGVLAMPVFPTTPGDFQRATARQGRPELTENRTLEPKAIRFGERLLEQFGFWLGEQGISLEKLFAQSIHGADDLYYAGMAELYTNLVRPTTPLRRPSTL